MKKKEKTPTKKYAYAVVSATGNIMMDLYSSQLQIFVSKEIAINHADRWIGVKVIKISIPSQR